MRKRNHYSAEFKTKVGLMGVRHRIGKNYYSSHESF